MTPEQQTSMRICPNCEAKIPKNVIICWGCGYCLDPHTRTLAKAAKEAKQ